MFHVSKLIIRPPGLKARVRAAEAPHGDSLIGCAYGCGRKVFPLSGQR